MKILIVRTFPDILNLQSYNVQEVGLAKALVKKGHTCDIVLYNGKQADRDEEYCFNQEGKSYQFTIHWLKGYNLFKNGFMPSLNKLIQEYDVIQVHEYDQILSWKLYTRQLRPTVIYHGPYYDSFAKGYNLKCKVFDRVFLPRRNYKDVVAISKSTLATSFLQEKGFKNVITAGVGINPDNFVSGIDYPAFDKKQEETLLYIGKLEERRNMYFLVDVFRELQKKRPKLHMVIIGNGEEEYKEDFLKSIQRELAAGSIEYRAKADQTELIQYYHNASFFVLASNYEIFGMVLLEAMYFGTPVISSKNGGSCTLIEDGVNGFVMDEFNKKDWAERIHYALNNPNMLEDMSERASTTIREHFIWDALAENFLKAYKVAIKESKRRTE